MWCPPGYVLATGRCGKLLDCPTCRTTLPAPCVVLLPATLWSTTAYTALSWTVCCLEVSRCLTCAAISCWVIPWTFSSLDSQDLEADDLPPPFLLFIIPCYCTYTYMFPYLFCCSLRYLFCCSMHYLFCCSLFMF